MARTSSPATATSIPKRIAIPADAPPIRVNPVDAEEAAAQSAADQDVLDAWNEWKAAGKPALFNSSPRNLYMVPKADVAKTKQRLNNAARLYPGVRIVFANTVQVDKDGMAWLYWVAKERQERAVADATRKPVKMPRASSTRPAEIASNIPRFIPPP